MAPAVGEESVTGPTLRPSPGHCVTFMFSVMLARAFWRSCSGLRSCSNAGGEGGVCTSKRNAGEPKYQWDQRTIVNRGYGNKKAAEEEELERRLLVLSAATYLPG